jgi:hypothetical protein
MIEESRMKLGRICRVLLVLALAGCGGGADDVVDEGDGVDTTSGGDETLADGGDALDPCAESEAPCEGETGAGDGEEPREGPDGDGDGEGDGETSTEGGDAGERNPQQEWRAQVRVGRQWFNRRCDTCHPGGEEDIGPNLRSIRWPVVRMRRQIRQGSGRMRPIPPARLPDDKMDALMAYLSTIGSVRGVSRPE